MASLRIKKGGCRPDQGDGCTGCERQNHIQRRHNLSRFGTTSFRHATSVLQFDLCKKRTRPESTWWHLVVARGGGARAEGAMQTPETPSAATTTVAVGNGDSAVTVTFEGEPMERLSHCSCSSCRRAAIRCGRMRCHARCAVVGHWNTAI